MKHSIRPIYKRDQFVGFAVHVNGEPVGRVFESYKHAAVLLRELQG